MPITTLFLDLNAYFASVEQQVQPGLRGRPVAVAPITSSSGCCIAASYEAKARGVKTGTSVGDARFLCPDIHIAPARPRLYVLMHHRVLRAIDRHAPVDKVHSIDEVSCRLDRYERTPEAAAALARRIKKEIRDTCGVCMRCSIGIAPNRTLAKLGTDLQKPDGLVILTDSDIPGTIAHLSPGELSGIGPAMTRRLQVMGINTIGELVTRSEPEMRALWRSVHGERWYHTLRGREVIEPPTRKASVGHQHVLAPEMRSPASARSVASRLLLKAGARMRHDGYAARKLSLGLRFAGDMGASGWNGPSWSDWASLGEGCTDAVSMMATLDSLWSRTPVRSVMLVGVTLHDLVPLASVTMPLFEEERLGANLSRAMDAVNQKFGANTLYTAGVHGARTHGTGGIAFNHIPDLAVADSVQSRQRTDATDAPPLLTDKEMERMIEMSL